MLTSVITPSLPANHCQNCYLTAPGLLSSWNKARRLGTILQLPAACAAAKQVFPVLGSGKKLWHQEHWHSFSLEVVQGTDTEVAGLYWEGFCWRQEWAAQGGGDGNSGSHRDSSVHGWSPGKLNPEQGNWGQNPALNPELEDKNIQKYRRAKRNRVAIHSWYTEGVWETPVQGQSKLASPFPSFYPTFLPAPCLF